MNLLLKQKLQAFLAHLGISLLIALFALAVVYLVWYPNPLDVATNVTRLFLLMVTIDIIIGPLLTFVVYKKGKKTLKFDLAVIGILQIAALLYGLYSVYDGRPAWIAYSVDRFDLVRANEIDVRNINKAKAEYKQPAWFGAEYVNATLDSAQKQNSELRNITLFDELEHGIAPSQKPELYRPINTAYAEIKKRALPLSQLNNFNNKATVNSIFKKHPAADSFVPLKANAVDMTVLINKKAGGEVVAIVDLRPW